MIVPDEGDMLSTTVGAVAATVPARAEIVVVKDDSSDGSADGIDERPQGAGAPPLPHDGVAPARDTGARPRAAELLVFTDAHVAPSPGWLELLADATRRPGVGADRQACGL